jgi:hypothetical protein
LVNNPVRFNAEERARINGAVSNGPCLGFRAITGVIATRPYRQVLYFALPPTHALQLTVGGAA